MATELVGSKQIIYQEDVDFSSTNSESIMTKVSKAALYAQGVTEYVVPFVYSGYFRSNSITTGAERFVVTKRSTINRYVLSLGSTGSSVANAINIKVYDEDGTFVNDLFSSTFEPSILTASNINNSYIGYDILDSSNILSTNISAETLNYGTINLTTLEEGYQLVGEIISNSSNAINANFTLTLQRLE